MHGERRVNMRASSLMLCLVSALAATGAFAQAPAESNPAAHQPSDPAARIGDAPRMIVRFRSTGSSDRTQIQSTTQGESAVQGAAAAPGSVVAKFASRSGFAIREVRGLMADMHLLHVDPRAGESFEQQLERVRSDPDVEFAVADERRFPQAVPNDPLYTGQWYLQNVQPAAIHARSEERRV